VIIANGEGKGRRRVEMDKKTTPYRRALAEFTPLPRTRIKAPAHSIILNYSITVSPRPCEHRIRLPSHYY
jgi:hypothetical protein